MGSARKGKHLWIPDNHAVRHHKSYDVTSMRDFRNDGRVVGCYLDT